MAGDGMSRTGGLSEVASIRRLILKRPQDAFVDERRIEAQWRDLRFTARPDLRKAAAEHERFAELLGGARAANPVLPPRGADGPGLDIVLAAVPLFGHGS